MKKELAKQIRIFFLQDSLLRIPLLYKIRLNNDGQTLRTFLTQYFYHINLYPLIYDDKKVEWVYGQHFSILDSINAPSSYFITYKGINYSKKYYEGLGYIEKNDPFLLNIELDSKTVSQIKKKCTYIGKENRTYIALEFLYNQKVLTPIKRPTIESNFFSKLKQKLSKEKFPDCKRLSIIEGHVVWEGQLKKYNTDKDSKWIYQCEDYEKRIERHKEYLDHQPNREQLMPFIKSLKPIKVNSIELSKPKPNPEKITIEKLYNDTMTGMHSLKQDQTEMKQDLSDIKGLLLKYSSKIEDVLNNSIDIEKFLVDHLSTDFEKIQNSWQDYKENRITLKDFIKEGLKILGKRFAERILNNIF